MRYLLGIILAVFLSVKATCQPSDKIIVMCEAKITQLIFPAVIKSFKGGFMPSDFAISTEDNVLYIQPVGSFNESNMNILTSDGCYYTFIVRYDPAAIIFNYIFTPNDAIFRETIDEGENVPLIDRTSTQVLQDPGGISRLILQKNGYLKSGNVSKVRNVSLVLKGIYTDRDNIFIRLEIDNKSNIDYEVDLISFSIKAKKSKRRTAREDLEIYPKSEHNNPEVVKSKNSAEVIFCFDKFTVGPEKFLQIFCIERGGERNLRMNVQNKIILDARNI